jgi:uncharacterized protein YegP (UPF0339 family)
MAEALAPISAAPEPDAALDPRALFHAGLASVRTLARTVWTDHNTHDPGITMLELACYALTDLAYRHTLPIGDLLVGPGDSAAQAADRFHAPQAVLPNRALTELDWRKLLIDLPGVKNAWLETVTDARLYADLRRRELRRTPPEHAAFEPVPLAGLTRVRIEFMPAVSTQAERNAVLARVREAVEASRNLCEDVVEVRAVRAEYFALCAEVDLDGDTDVTEAAAQLLFTVGEALAPAVPSHDIATMRARGLTLPEIIDGPMLVHGFIDDAELQATALPAELRLSDLIGIAMDVPGIRSIRSLVLNPIERDDEADETALNAAPEDVQGEAVPLANPWRIPVRHGRQPRLSLNHGRITFAKRGLAVQGWSVATRPAAVTARLGELHEAARLRLETPAGTALPPPVFGRIRALADWTSFQHDFPALYGIGPQGLGERADDRRRAQALQLQGWLLFFDQLMADQLAQLASARRRLSVAPADLDDVARRFSALGDDRHALATQLVRSIVAWERLYPEGATARQLADAIESPAAAARRQQAWLDHLLARVAEDFADYAAATASAFGHDSDRLIGDKCRFLQRVAADVHDRAGAMHQRPATAEEVWNTANVSGAERRIAGLLGIADFTRRNLGVVSHDTYHEVDAVPDNAAEFRFRVRHAVDHHILLSSSTNYPTPESAREEMIHAIERGQRPEGYQRLRASDGRFYFNIVDAGGEVIARRIRYYDEEAARDAAIEELMTYLVGHYGGEGMYLVEHILLRPVEADDPMFPICTDPGCPDCSELDPYSYRVHVVLPAYAGRFQDEGFRRFVEQTIRHELPAHVLPTVCWIGADDMARFESAWRHWLLLHAGFSTSGRRTKLQALIDALVGVKNVYPARSLYDCTGDEAKPPFILGKTSLGRGPTGSA